MAEGRGTGESVPGEGQAGNRAKDGGLVRLGVLELGRVLGVRVSVRWPWLGQSGVRVVVRDWGSRPGQSGVRVGVGGLGPRPEKSGVRVGIGDKLRQGRGCDRLVAGVGFRLMAGTGAEGWGLGPLRRDEAQARFMVMVWSGALDWVGLGRAGLG
eukprot:g25040.t1